MAKTFSHDSEFYNQAPVAKQWKRSIFPIQPDRASNFTSFDMGELVPLIKPIKVLPHDTFVFDLGSLIRMSNPLIAPLMDTIDFDAYAFFVPERLVFDKTKEFYGQNDSAGARSTEITQPRVPITAFTYVDSLSTFMTDAEYRKTIASHFGIPFVTNTNPNSPNNVSYVNVLPFRGLVEIWNWYFRDQNLQNAFLISRSGSGDTYNNQITVGTQVVGSMAFNYGGFNAKLLKACKKHDFFTSMLPYAEKALVPLTLPMTGYADVKVQNDVATGITASSVLTLKNTTGMSAGAVTSSNINVSGSSFSVGTSAAGGSGLIADMTSVTAASVRALRQVLDLDHLLEIDAMAGTRYDEQIFAHFGARPLAESYKPQLLGEAHFKINVDQVLAHAGSNDETLGETGAYSLTGNRSHLVSQSFSEPGYLYVLGVARQNVHIYSQGLDPMWSISRRFDNYYPEFQDLGLVEFKKRTIMCKNTVADENTFGFAEYGNEYRVFTPMVTGDLNPNFSNSLDFWTLGDQLQSSVMLSPSFIEETKDNLQRALSDQNMTQFIGRFGLKGTMTRVVALHSIPKGL